MSNILQQLESLQPERRQYILMGLVQHLYDAQDWPRLFDLLDTGHYGRAKIYYDPTTYSYSQDLELGRLASTRKELTLEEGIKCLPFLWRYTLLQCSLTNLVDRFPIGAFGLLVLLKREDQALRLTELLTDPVYKVNALLEIVRQMKLRLSSEQEQHQVLRKAYELAYGMKDSKMSFDASTDYVKALINLGENLALSQQWQLAKSVWAETEIAINKRLGEVDVTPLVGFDFDVKPRVELAKSLAGAHQWELAKAVISLIKGDEKARALCILGGFLAQMNEQERAEIILAEAEAAIHSIGEEGPRARALLELLRVRGHLHQSERVTDLYEEYSALEPMIEDPQEKVEIMIEYLCELGELRARSQDIKESYQLWIHAIRLARYLSNKIVSHKFAQAEALCKVSISLTRAHQLESAKTIALQLHGMSSNDELIALRELSDAFVQAGQWGQAREILLRVEGWERAKALFELSEKLAHAQQWEQAEETINLVEEGIADNLKARALAELGKALALAQQWERANAICETMESVIKGAGANTEMKESGLALAEFGKALVLTNQPKEAELVWTDAMRIIDAMKGGYDKSGALREFVSLLIDVQEWERAEALAFTIKESRDRNSALYALGASLARAQQWEQAEAVIRAIEGNGDQIWAKANALRALGASLARAQQWELAEAVRREAAELMLPIRDRISPLRSDNLRMLLWWQTRAEEQYELSEVLAKSHLWQQAEAVIRSIEDEDERVRALMHLGEWLVQEEQGEKAERIWKRVETAIRRKNLMGSEMGLYLEEDRIQQDYGTDYVSDGQERRPIKLVSTRAELLCELSESFARIGLWKRAEKLWTELEMMIRTIKDSEQRADALIALIEVLARVQQWERAEKVVREINKGINEDELRAEVLWKLGEALVLAQQWERAEKVIRKINEDELRAEALCKLGEALVHAQQWERAGVVLKEAEVAISFIKEVWSRANALCRLGEVLSHSQQHKSAEGVWQRAEEVIFENREHNLLINLAKALTAVNEERRLLHLIQESWLRTVSRKDLCKLLSLAYTFASRNSDIAIAFNNAFAWVDAFLQDKLLSGNK